jgi:hypothetical protein
MFNLNAVYDNIERLILRPSYSTLKRTAMPKLPSNSPTHKRPCLRTEPRVVRYEQVDVTLVVVAWLAIIPLWA